MAPNCVDICDDSSHEGGVGRVECVEYFINVVVPSECHKYLERFFKLKSFGVIFILDQLYLISKRVLLN